MNTAHLKHVQLAVLAMAAIAWSTSTYGADKADTTRSMMRLSAKAADAKAKHDLVSILQPAGRFVKGMHARVVMQTMYTRPYGTSLRGLCRMDELSVHYAATAAGPQAIDEPLRPYGLEAQPLFHVTHGPVSSYAQAGPDAGPWAGDCAKLQSTKSAGWFSAPKDLEAAKGVNVFLAAMSAIRSGELKAKNCNLGRDGKTCEEQILQLGQESNIMALDKDCPTLAASAGPLSECFEITTTGYVQLTIVASFAPDSVEPERVQSISASQVVVVT